MKSTYEYRRLIKANDRATLLNLMIGLNATRSAPVLSVKI